MAQVGAWHQLGRMVNSAVILFQAAAACIPRRHVVIVFCILWFHSAATAPSSAGSQMVHCRSAIGKWKHDIRSWERGYGKRPSATCPFPPPPPPPYCGEEIIDSIRATDCHMESSVLDVGGKVLAILTTVLFLLLVVPFLLETPRRTTRLM